METVQLIFERNTHDLWHLLFIALGLSLGIYIINKQIKENT